MKKIEAIIRPSRLDVVKDALTRLRVTGITVSQVRGQVFGRSCRLVYRCHEYTDDLEPKVKVEVVVGAREADDVVQAVIEAARTGDIDDGQVFVSEVSEAIRICNSQRDEAAV